MKYKIPKLTLWQKLTYSKKQKEEVVRLDILWLRADLASYAYSVLEKLGADKDVLDKVEKLAEKMLNDYQEYGRRTLDEV